MNTLSTVTAISDADPEHIKKQKAAATDRIEGMIDDIESSERYPKQGYASDAVSLRGISDRELGELEYRMDKRRKEALKALVARIQAYETEHNLPRNHLIQNDVATIKRLAGLK